MGQKLEGLFAEAGKISLQAKMKLIMLTSLTTTKAAEAPDSPDLLQKVGSALQAVKAEFK